MFGALLGTAAIIATCALAYDRYRHSRRTATPAPSEPEHDGECIPTSSPGEASYAACVDAALEALPPFFRREYSADIREFFSVVEGTICSSLPSSQWSFLLDKCVIEIRQLYDDCILCDETLDRRKIEEYFVDPSDSPDLLDSLISECMHES